MPSDNLSMDDITQARREAIVQSIHALEIDELKKLGEALFPSVDHPWRERFFTFVTENENCTFYHATTNDRIHIIYCHPKDNGMWFLPGSGMGPLQTKGLHILKEIVEAGIRKA